MIKSDRMSTESGSSTLSVRWDEEGLENRRKGRRKIKRIATTEKEPERHMDRRHLQTASTFSNTDAIWTVAMGTRSNGDYGALSVSRPTGENWLGSP